MNKIYSSDESALQGLVEDGMTLAVGGFGLCGIPEAFHEGNEKTQADGAGHLQIE